LGALEAAGAVDCLAMNDFPRFLLNKPLQNLPQQLYASRRRQVQRKMETHSLLPQGKCILTHSADATDQAKKNRTRLAIDISDFLVKKWPLLA
jgi:hypothetical protein